MLGIGTGDTIEIDKRLGSERNQYRFGYTGNNPHNFYISLLSLYGIPIVIIIYFYIFNLLKFSFKSIHHVLKVEITKTNVIALGMITGYICWSIAQFFESYAIESIISTWLLLGIVVGYVNSSRKEVFYRKHV